MIYVDFDSLDIDLSCRNISCRLISSRTWLLLDMESSTEAAYAAFVKKVKRTIYVDNLSPQVTESVVRTAFDQLGVVKSVSFIPNYIEPSNMPNCALVEMEDAKQAGQVVSELCVCPFMMSGMPRPIRARHAEVDMFDERPKEPGRSICFQWLDPTDPNFETAKRLKRLVRKHAVESSFLLKQQLDREEKLAKQQGQYLKSNYKKLEMIDEVIRDKTTGRMAHVYGIGDRNPR